MVLIRTDEVEWSVFRTLSYCDSEGTVTDTNKLACGGLSMELLPSRITLTGRTQELVEDCGWRDEARRGIQQYRR
jgi:hypothetical protein